MSDEPQRNIEKLLESYAQKRRKDAGAPLELHPVTRRLLQDEVARRKKHEATAGKSFFQSFFRALRPRWAYAATMIGLFALLAAIVIPSLQHGKEENRLNESEVRGADVARLKKTASGSEFAPSAAKPSPPAAAPPVTTADEFSDLSLNAKSKAAEGLTPVEFARDSHNPSSFKNAGDFVSDGSTAAKASALNIATLPAEGDRRNRSDAPLSAAGVPTSAGEYRKKTAGAAGNVNEPSANPTITDSAKLEAKRAEDSVALGRLTDTSRSSATTPASKTTATVDSAGGKLPATNSSPGERDYFASAGGKEKTRRYVQSALPLKQDNRERAAVADLAAAARTTVLAAFDFEQDGDDIRITDADGSVYSGKVQRRQPQQQPVRLGVVVAPSPSGGDTLARRAESPKDAVSQSDALRQRYGLVTAPPQQGIAFRVEGTNRSLNQLVVVNGNVLLDTNAVVTLATNATAALNFEAQAEPSPARGQASVPASRITGNARLENGVEIEIDASAQQRAPAGPTAPLKK